MYKTYAAFLKNVVEPIIDKLSDIVWYAEENGLPIDKESIRDGFDKIFKAHLIDTVLHLITYIIIAGIVCFTVTKVL